MRKRLDISIKNPCQENWAAFDKQGDFGLCRKCEFSIVDFTNKSGGEIEEYLSKNRGKVCGLLRQDQLYSFSQNEYSIFRKITLATLGLLTITTISQALPTKIEIKPSIEIAVGRNNQQDILIRNILTVEKFRFFGTVISQGDSSEIPGVNILVKGTQNGVTTDIKGKFEIYITGEIGDKVKLEISFIGFKTIEKQISLTADHFDLGKFVLVPDVIFLGEIRIPWWKRLWWRIKGFA